MAAQTQRTPWEHAQNIYSKLPPFYQLTGSTSVVTILLIFGGFLFVENTLDDYTTNVFTEALGVLSTVLIVDILNRRRDERERKEELIFQMGSEDNSTALGAARMLRHKGWLENGSLKHAKLVGANLEGAGLDGANLEGAKLSWANLEGAWLSWVNLKGTRLSFANLKGASLYLVNLQDADLYNVNLEGAKLWNANLEDAKLWNANLKGTELMGANLKSVNLSFADLWGANLKGANLEGAKLEHATLPDGTTWTPDTDMARFTDPNHPDFWQPDKKD